jgi:hypothetical protein
MKTRNTKRARPRPLSRPRLNYSIGDLVRHVGEQITFVEAIAKLTAPNGETIIAALPMLTWSSLRWPSIYERCR